MRRTFAKARKISKSNFGFFVSLFPCKVSYFKNCQNFAILFRQLLVMQQKLFFFFSFPVQATGCPMTAPHPHSPAGWAWWSNDRLWGGGGWMGACGKVSERVKQLCTQATETAIPLWSFYTLCTRSRVSFSSGTPRLADAGHARLAAEEVEHGLDQLGQVVLVLPGPVASGVGVVKVHRPGVGCEGRTTSHISTTGRLPSAEARRASGSQVCTRPALRLS